VPVVLNSDPLDPDANSFTDVDFADAYHEARLHSDAWVDADADEKPIALIMATRVITAILSPRRTFIPEKGYTRVSPTWTGTPATDDQALPWPRISMLTRNGVAIPDDVFPNELQEATAEFALQLLSTDRTLDNDVVAGGITDLSAGPVSLSFKEYIEAKVLPDAVVNLLVPSWLTEETIEGTAATGGGGARFRMVGE
jgi:hypothetical protein